MGIKVFQIDAFTDTIFHGNPAGVCILSEPPDEKWAQALAMEMNLSETAFLYPEGDHYHLRWFTPTVEVELCGHATLASAHILWEENYLDRKEKAIFHTKSGILQAELDNGWIKLDFPANPCREASPPQGLIEALGVKAKFIGVNKFDYLVEVESEDIVKNITPNLLELSKLSVRGVIVTSQAERGKIKGEFDFISRFFAPGSGIDEDPVTGSAHCCLGPYWQQKLNKHVFYAYQASKRGGALKVEVIADRVYLHGQAVTVLKGELIKD